MRDLIEAIRKLRKSEVGYLIGNRMNEFREKGAQSSREIFKELCFCILCANFNAQRGIEIQEEIGNGFLNLSESKLARKLRETGYRYPNTRAKYILEARKFKNPLKKIMNSFVNEIDLRDWLAKNVTGLGYKEASLPDYEEVSVIIDGKFELMRIADLYREYYNGNLNQRRLETFSFNPETLKFETAPVTNVLKHECSNDLYEIKLEWGRRVTTTGDHSVFTVGNNGIIPVEVRLLKTGDFMAIPRRLPTLDSVETELNLVQEFIERGILGSFFLKSKEYCDFLRENYRTEIARKNEYTQHFRGVVPLKVVARLPQTAYSIAILKKFKVRISLRASPSTIDSIIQLDRDFFWVLGLLVAEAAKCNNPIEFTLGLEEHKRFMKLNRLLSRSLGLNVNKYYPKNRNVYISRINNPLFFHLIRDVLGIKGFSRTEAVPKVVFSSSFPNIVSFLQGYWEGDGWKRSKSYFSVHTSSRKLAKDLLLLLLMVGVVARACKKKSRGLSGTGTCIDYSGIIQPIQLENKAPLNKREVIPNTGEMTHEILRKMKIRSKIRRRNTSLYNKVMRWKHLGNPSRMMLNRFLIDVQERGGCQEVDKLKRIVDSDLSFAEIRRIRAVPYRGKYVYDLEVAQKGKDFQNFIGGVGGVCLHNSHFLRNVGYTDCAIIDFHILDILARWGLIDRPKTLTKQKYFEIEDVLRRIGARSGLSLGELDLYLWYMETGKVLK
ncbi:MAG: LAGLIDADG family homing endonuclease [Promethearchaeati archaeon SRVP18_Atabeyarchaeia-1]